jgi:hypothetical protein
MQHEMNKIKEFFEPRTILELITFPRRIKQEDQP